MNRHLRRRDAAHAVAREDPEQSAAVARRGADAGGLQGDVALDVVLRGALEGAWAFVDPVAPRPHERQHAPVVEVGDEVQPRGQHALLHRRVRAQRRVELVG